MIGSQSLVNDPSSYIVECGDMHVLYSCAWLMQECVVISSKKAIMTTLQPKHVWEDAVTKLAQESPSACISAIKFRKSLGLPGSVVWIKPLLLQDEMQKAKQQASLKNWNETEQERASLHTILRIEGMPLVQHEAVCDELIGKVSLATGILLNKSTSSIPGTHEWAICYRGGVEFSQKIAIQLADEKELHSMIAHIQGCGIKVGGLNLLVEVKSIHPQFHPAGTSSRNFVTPPTALVNHFGGGTCL